MIDQEKIHNQCLSDDPKERIQALDQLLNSSLLQNKQQTWEDLLRLTNDEDSFVRSRAADALVSAFSHVPDKQKAWEDLIRLTNDIEHRARHRAADTLSSAFSEVPDKQKAWEDLHRLTNDEDHHMKYCAAYALSSAFSEVPDKQKAWKDLLRLIKDEDISVSSQAVDGVISSFSQMPDKQQTWEDLLRLTLDEDSIARYYVVDALGSAFFYVPDKQQAWNDLFRLTYYEDNYMRNKSAEALSSAFSQVPNKQQAWNDLHRLTNDKDCNVRSSAASALGSAFYLMPDKQQAWNDLERLTNDEDKYVRSKTAEAIGSAFSQIQDKQQAWNDLDRLTNDKNNLVRTYANYSLGKISIFKASQAGKDEDYRKELENAIEFFEFAAEESPERWFNPSRFCLPFYRSFHTILFTRQKAKEEVDRYLVEAKSAIEESKSKKLLIEAVENLAKALEEVQDLESLDLETKKDELNFYRKYCDHAAELMKDTNEKAPFATEVLRKGLPILDRNLKELLKEIQEKAKAACQVSQGTATQEIACAVNEEIQKWEIGCQEEMTQMIENLAYVLEEKISVQPKNQFILSKIEKMKNENNLVHQYEILAQIIPLIRNVTVVPADPVIEKIEGSKKEVLEEIRKISEKLDYVAVSTKPGINEELILHLGYITSVGGVEYTLTIPLQGISHSEIKEELKELTGKRINQLSMLPKKVDKIVRDYLIENKMEDLLSKLC